MNIKIPLYIPESQVKNIPITFRWDDWDPYPLIGKNEPSTEQLLSKITNYGKFVFSLGCAEWVVARLDQFLENDLPWKYLDACWAFEMSSNFALPVELDDSEWGGRVLGPICLVLTTVINTRYGFDENNAETDSAFAEKIALHVLPDFILFKEWRDNILSKLLHLCPVDRQHPLGERLPRDVLNPKSTINTNQFSPLLASSIEGLNIHGNPYIRSHDFDE